MPGLSETVKTRVRDRLAVLPNPVRIVVFTQENECRYCKEAQEMAQDLAGLSDKLPVKVCDLSKDAEQAARYPVDRTPAFVIVGEQDYGIRYYGVPAGFEFTTLLALVELVGRRDSGLKPEQRAKLAGLALPVNLQVFVTLTCPVCPLAAGTAAGLAIEKDNISLSIIDAGEFPELAGLYNVMAVPKTVVNRGHSFEGALPEDRFVDEVLKGVAASKGRPE